jgi:small subunit ribosomal protein S18
LAAFYQRKHTERSKSREKDFGVRVPTEKIQEELERVELGESAPSITCKKRFQDLERGIVDFDEEESDMPVNLRSDPFGKNIHKCVFCKYDIPLDYKNTQLLSQFVSQHTGIVYSQEVTGLCIYKYREVESMIVRARKVGIMPFFYKETTFLGDPELFDPYRNNLKSVPNNYDKRKLNADPAVVEDKKPPQSGL